MTNYPKKAIFALLACFFFFLFSSSFLMSQGPLNVLSHTKGGAAYEIRLHNNLLFVGAANTLMVYDLSGPNNTPGSLLFEERFGSNIDQLLVHNGYLYMCANHDGLYKLDVSNPNSITVVAHRPASNPNEAVYDVGFKGDSIFVAAKQKLLLLRDDGNSFAFLTAIDSVSDDARIRGLDLKGNLLAYTVAYSTSNALDGIYLRDASSLQQIGFYNQPVGDPLEVYFGQQTDLLHVMGGNFNLFRGFYYALNYSNPAAMYEVYSDTIEGGGITATVPSPMSAEIINDTVYVATQGGLPRGITFPVSGQVFVYDATSSNTVSPVEDLYAGLYHFDIAIDPATRLMYVASEWYGVLTMDINDLQNEVDLGQTRTGGWCNGSAFVNGRLFEASEGFGVRLFDVSDPETPVWLAEDTTVGFSRAVSLSDSADYAYGWFLTNDQFRVYDANTLAPLGSIYWGLQLIAEFRKSRIMGSQVAVVQELGLGNNRLLIADVTDPNAPMLQHTRPEFRLKDLIWHPSGRLLALSGDSLLVFDTSNMSLVDGERRPNGFNPSYGGFAYSMDTLYVYYRTNLSSSILRYHVDPATAVLTYVDDAPFVMEGVERVHMAVDDSLLYLTSTLDPLLAVEKTAPHNTVASYRHSGDFIRDNLWGVTDLYRAEDYLILNHYFGQTTIFGPPTPVGTLEPVDLQEPVAYPSPAEDRLRIRLVAGVDNKVSVMDLQGREVWRGMSSGDVVELNVAQWPQGLYFVTVEAAGKRSLGKVLVRR